MSSHVGSSFHKPVLTSSFVAFSTCSSHSVVGGFNGQENRYFLAPKGTVKDQCVVKSPATSSARPKAPRALKVHNSDAAVEGCLKHFKHLTQEMRESVVIDGKNLRQTK